MTIRLRFVEPMLRQAGEPVQAKPCGRALPGLDRTPGFAFRSTYAKRSQTQNRTSHLLFNPDILTCYEQTTEDRHCCSFAKLRVLLN
jgi:hypothetical protein